MRYLSLFTGIGGFELGLDAAGWTPLMFCENNTRAREVLELRYPHVEIAGDVRTLDGVECDAIVGGFPCQPVSSSGNRRGRDDPRWLWPHFARLIAATRPQVVLAENVAGLRSLGLAEVLRDLGRLGYDAVWRTVYAHQVGLPHRRERILIAAWPTSSTDPAIPKRLQRDGELSAGRVSTWTTRAPAVGPLWLTPIGLQPDRSPNTYMRRFERTGGKVQLSLPVLARADHQDRMTVGRSARVSLGDERADDAGWLNPEWVEALMGFPIGWTDPHTPNEQLRSISRVAPPGTDQYPDEPSRTTTNHDRRRTTRIFQLGNAVVPQLISRWAGTVRGQMAMTR